MTEHLRDLHQRDLDGHHLAGHGVAQPVRADFRHARPPAGPTHRGGHRARRDRLERRPGLQEHLATVSDRSAAGEVGGEGLTDIDGQREPVPTGALAHHHQLAGPPVDVFEPDAGHLAASKTKAQQRDDQCVVAPTDPGAAVARAEQRGGLVLADPPGK